MSKLSVKFGEPRPKRSLVINTETVFTLKVFVTLTFDLVTFKINRGHLLLMTKLPTKFGEPRPKHSLVIDWKPSGLWTDNSKTIYPIFVEGGVGGGGA